jgi:hypothetical protein
MKCPPQISKPGIFLICSMICLTACKKEPEPLALTTSGVNDITYSSASSGGNITSDGGSDITARGVCRSQSQNRTAGDSKTEEGSGSGAYSSTLTNQTPNSTYYVRAYATNSDGTKVSGFTALPGGYRGNSGQYYSIEWQGRWWTSGMIDNMNVWTRHMQSNIANINWYDMNRNYGFSVRCLKD